MQFIGLYKISQHQRRFSNECVFEDKTKIEAKQDNKTKRMEGWKDKVLHGQYPKRTGALEVSSWDWLKRGWMKKETEGMLMAAQDQALPTRNYKVRVMKEQGSSKCRMCGQRDETIMHILSECEKLAQGSTERDMTGWLQPYIGNCVICMDSTEIRTGMGYKNWYTTMRSKCWKTMISRSCGISASALTG